MSKFNTHKNVKIFIKCAQIGTAHLQCVNNLYAKFEYKGMNSVGVTDYTNLRPPTHYRLKKCLSSTPIKNESPPKPMDEIQPNLVCELLT